MFCEFTRVDVVMRMRLPRASNRPPPDRPGRDRRRSPGIGPPVPGFGHRRPAAQEQKKHQQVTAVHHCAARNTKHLLPSGNQACHARAPPPPGILSIVKKGDSGIFKGVRWVYHSRLQTTPAHPLDPSLYELLEVSPKAGAAVIKAAYRTLVQLYHPDKNPGNPAAAERLTLINQAYAVLADPLLKARYDEKRAASDERRSGRGLAQAKPEAVKPDAAMRPFAFRRFQ